MVFLKLMFVFIFATMICCYPTEKKVESEKLTKQEKAVGDVTGGKKNDKLQSSESIHYPIPIMFFHPLPYVASYMPHHLSYSYGGSGGKQNGLTSNYGLGYSYGGHAGYGQGNSGFGYVGSSYGSVGSSGYSSSGSLGHGSSNSLGYGSSGSSAYGYGSSNHGSYGGSSGEHGHTHGNWHYS